jgi:Mor family transcriptional regulator
MASYNTIDEVTATVDRRLEELRPLTEEFEALTRFREVALAEFSGTTSEPNGRKLKARLSKKPNAPAGPKVSMTEKVLTTVRAHEGGVTVDEIAKEVHTATSYVYRIARKLEADGQIARQDKRLVPTS